MKEQTAFRREAKIIETSLIGIGANLLLVGFKTTVGLLSHSLAIVMDAVNNLTDALSSVITVIGTRLAIKPADKEHPYGYGRYEYVSAALISMIVLYAGFTALIKSVGSILHPETPDYSGVTLLIVTAAVLVKIVPGLFVKRRGNVLHSDSLVNSGQDALMDAVIDFLAPDNKEVYQNVCQKVTALYPDYTFRIQLDSDFSD